MGSGNLGLPRDDSPFLEEGADPTTQNPAGRPWSVAANHRRQDQSPNFHGTMEIRNPEDSHALQNGGENSRESSRSTPHSAASS
jgi:hypothetical protein